MQRQLSLVTPSFQGGGVERVMLNLANGLAAEGVRVDLVAISGHGPYVDQAGEGVRVVDLAAPRLVRALPALVRYLLKERPEAVLAALDYLNVGTLLANRLAGSPARVVVTTHKYFSLATRRSDLRRDRWLLPIAMRMTYPWAHGVVTVADAMAEDLSSSLGLPRERITVIPNPAVTSALLKKAAEAPDHPWLTEEPGVPLVIGMGRLHKEKDFATLLRGFAVLRRILPARLIILGEGPERLALASCASDLGIERDLHLPGFVGNPYAILARSDLFVMSSVNEGLPTALIEAMACGCPVVSTDCPSGPAEILENGLYGRLVPVGDHEALAGAMKATLDSPPPQEMLKARAEIYHVDRVVDQYRAMLGV